MAKTRAKQGTEIMYWFPRTIALLFTLFIYSFVVEVFVQGFTWSSFILAMLPGTVLLIATLIAWRYEIEGGFIFVLLGVLYLLLVMFSTVSIEALTVISGIPIFTGALFILNKTMTPEIQTAKAKTKKKKK